MLRGVVLGVLLAAGLVPGPVRAGSPSSVVSPVRASVLAGVDSIRFKLMAYLARGDIAGAIVLYETETGQAAPAWLMELQGAYSVANQVAGKCQQVARILHTAFTKLGQTPQYVAFTTSRQTPYMVFELASGKNVSVSHTGYHVAVRLGDLIYDAYTGPLGMKLSDYLSRMHTQQAVVWEVVSKP